ncbi:MAG: sugar phosphate isomerase/epimerase family protein [Verrucomicrobiota bacterium]
MIHPIHIGTVLLEPNRWTAEKQPSFRVSDWLDRFAVAGFDGVELWQNHALKADERERRALAEAALPIPIFNSYASLGEEGRKLRATTVEWVKQIGCRALKFNVGKDPALVKEELNTAREWGEEMPGVQLLCECHGGTSLEDPETAARVLAGYPQIGIIVHPFTDSKLPDWLRLFGKRVRHAHSQFVGEDWRRTCLREQPALVRDRLSMLTDAKFDGSISIEFTAGVAAPPEDREQLFCAACDDMNFLRELEQQVCA